MKAARGGPVKRKRGRPKGSKNKKKATITTATFVTNAKTTRKNTARVVLTSYSPAKPSFHALKYDDGSKPKFKPHQWTQRNQFDAKFRFPPPRPEPGDARAVIMQLSRLYLSDNFMFEVFQHTQEYIKARHLSHSQRYKITQGDIYQFFAIVYYMGYSKLPAKSDYWRPADDLTASHPVCVARGMSFRKFNFNWRNIYLIQQDKKRLQQHPDHSNDEGMLLNTHTEDGFVCINNSATDIPFRPQRLAHL